MNDMEMLCTYLVDDMIACGEPGEVEFNFVLCEDHRQSVYEMAPKIDRSLEQSLNYHAITDFPGYCYVLLLPGGNVKIGYSNTPKLVLDRFKRLRRELGPIVPLAVMRGGWAAERVFHTEFAHLRNREGVESFDWSPELADKVEGIGIVSEVYELLQADGSFV